MAAPLHFLLSISLDENVYQNNSCSTIFGEIDKKLAKVNLRQDFPLVN